MMTKNENILQQIVYIILRHTIANYPEYRQPPSVELDKMWELLTVDYPNGKELVREFARYYAGVYLPIEVNNWYEEDCLTIVKRDLIRIHTASQYLENFYKYISKKMQQETTKNDKERYEEDIKAAVLLLGRVNENYMTDKKEAKKISVSLIKYLEYMENDYTFQRECITCDLVRIYDFEKVLKEVEGWESQVIGWKNNAGVSLYKKYRNSKKEKK